MAAIGEVIWHGGSTAPSGWLLCDGSFVSTTTYADLFALLGHAFNGGTDPLAGTLKVPGLTDRMGFGLDTGRDGRCRGSRPHRPVSHSPGHPAVRTRLAHDWAS